MLWRLNPSASPGTIARLLAHARRDSPDRCPDPAKSDKAYELAYVRVLEAIPCTRWSHRQSIYRMTTINPYNSWL